MGIAHCLLSLFCFWRSVCMPRKSNLESGFQDRLKKDIENLYPDAMVFKMNQKQGVPDLLILYKDRWASLECKRCKDAARQPNQDYYVEKMNGMSFSRFVYPENKEEVLNELQQTFEPDRSTWLFGCEQIPLG